MVVPLLRQRKPVNSKMTERHSVELIGYQTWALTKCRCTVLITNHQSLKGCEHFPVFLFVFLLIYLSSSSKKEFANVLRSEAARREVFDLKKKCRHSFVPRCSVNFRAKFQEIPSILHTLLIHLKRRHLAEIVLRVFAF